MSKDEIVHMVRDSAQLSKTVTDDEIRVFAQITGDNNPLHIDDEFASTSIFRRRVAHGVLTAALVLGVIGTKLPGPGTVYVSQCLDFRAPVYPGDTITAKVEVLEISAYGKRMKLNTQITNRHGTVVLDGHAFAIPPKRTTR